VLLAASDIRVTGCRVELGGIPADGADHDGALFRPFFAAADAVVPAWEGRVRQAVADGDSLGGIVEVVATGVPAGLGEPVFDKLDARLAGAIMGVGAVKGVEIGAGFAAARLTGSVNNDPLVTPGTAPGTKQAGGIPGGSPCGARAYSPDYYTAHQATPWLPTSFPFPRVFPLPPCLPGSGIPAATI